MMFAVPAFAVIHDRVLGVDVVGHVPVGDLADETGMGLGALLRYENKLQDALALTARIGYLAGLNKEITSNSKKGLDVAPVMLGAVYRTTGTPDGLFISGEVGANFLRGHTTIGTTTTNADMETKFGANVGVGLRANALSFRGGLNILDLGHIDTSMGLMVSVGYDFKKL
jgi:hypothetical protein